MVDIQSLVRQRLADNKSDYDKGYAAGHSEGFKKGKELAEAANKEAIMNLHVQIEKFRDALRGIASTTGNSLYRKMAEDALRRK